jgi:hypothetical protein
MATSLSCPSIITRRPGGSLGHTAYREQTYTKLYLNVKLHHHPSYKQSVLSTLTHTVKAISDQGCLHTKPNAVQTAFCENEYSIK